MEHGIVMKALILRALRWWTLELIGLLPTAWRPGREGHLALWHEGQLTLWRLHADGPPQPVSDPQSLGAAPLLLRLVGQRPWRRQFRLPLAAQPYLSEIFSNEMDSRTPWRAEQIYFHLDAGRDPSDALQLVVTLVALPRVALEPVLRHLADLDLRADRLELSDSVDPAAIGPMVALGDGKMLAAGTATPSLRPAAMIASLVLLALLSLAAQGVWQQALERKLANARQTANQTLALAGEIEATRRRQNFPLYRKQESIPAAAVLNALAHALPDDSWAEQIDLANDGIEVIGISTDAARLLSLLDQGGFVGAEFRAPVVPQEQGGEKFHLAAKISDGRKLSDAAR